MSILSIHFMVYTYIQVKMNEDISSAIKFQKVNKNSYMHVWNSGFPVFSVKSERGIGLGVKVCPTQQDPHIRRKLYRVGKITTQKDPRIHMFVKGKSWKNNL